MGIAVLEELVRTSRMEKIAPDLGDAEQRWRNATSETARAKAILEEEASQANARIACLLTWDAGLDLLHGWLALLGYRVTSERGHHSAAVQAVKALFHSRPEALELVRGLDSLRRLRDSALYNNNPVDPDDVLPYLPQLTQLADWLGAAVLRT
jgi:hypothetical protein